MPSGKALIINTMNKLINQRKGSEASCLSKLKNRQLHAAALISKSGRYIGSGENRYGARFLSINNSKHSETECIKTNIGKSKDHTSLIMLVIRPNGGNSRPCYHCTKKIEKYGNIKRVYYSYINSDGSKVIKYESINDLLNPDNYHFSKFHKSKLSQPTTQSETNCNSVDCDSTDCCSGDDCSSDDCSDEDSDDAKQNLVLMLDMKGAQSPIHKNHIYKFNNTCTNYGFFIPE